MSKRLILNAQPIPDRAIVLDTETTGFTPKQGHRIVELAAIELIQGRPSGARFHTYLNPQCPVPPEACRVHGLTTQFLRDKPLFGSVARKFSQFIGDPATPIWAHNASFDQRFVEAEMRNAGVSFSHIFSCSLKLARALPHGAETNKLELLTQLIGYKWGDKGAHSALEDTDALAAVLTRLLWPLEAREALKEPAPKAPRKPKVKTDTADVEPKSVLPDGFVPASAQTDPRIRRYDDLSLDGKLFARGQKWNAQEESKLVRGFVLDKACMDQLITTHGRTPAALLMKLEALGIVEQGHPYSRT